MFEIFNKKMSIHFLFTLLVYIFCLLLLSLFTYFSRQRMEQMVQRRESQTNLGKDMKRAAFRVFSALAATDEDIRKKIIDTDDLMNQVIILKRNVF